MEPADIENESLEEIIQTMKQLIVQAERRLANTATPHRKTDRATELSRRGET